MTIEEIAELFIAATRSAVENWHDSRHPKLKEALLALRKYSDEREAKITELTREMRDRIAAGREEESCYAFDEVLAERDATIARLRKPISVHIGTSVLSRDLVWCECGRGLALSGKWIYCPTCGGSINQDSYRSAVEQVYANGASHFYKDPDELVSQLVQSEAQIARLRKALEEIREASRSVPDQFGSDRTGDCSLASCRCSNHVARAALDDTPQSPKPCIGKDPTCPCQDGDMCHYEGPDAWPIPDTPQSKQDGTA